MPLLTIYQLYSGSRAVLLMDETKAPGENHWSAASQDKLYHIKIGLFVYDSIYTCSFTVVLQTDLLWKLNKEFKHSYRGQNGMPLCTDVASIIFH